MTLCKYSWLTLLDRVGRGIHQGLLGQQPERVRGRKTLVLDLDETLVHSQFNPVKNQDYIIPVDIENRVCNIYVTKRPGAEHFLREMANYYEVVIYTASLSKVSPFLFELFIVRRSADGPHGPAWILHKTAVPRALSICKRSVRQRYVLARP